MAGTATWTPEQLAGWAAGLADNPPPFGPGQFRYERAHEWSSAPWNNEPGLFYEFTRDVETWVPHDYRAEWLQRLGPQTVVRVEGTEKTTEPPQAGWDLREPCGNLRELPPIEEPERTEPCDGNGWFWAASPEFYRSLTGDPQKLYDAIRKQVTSEFRGNDLDFLGKADQLLEPNTPNDFKATLFEAMSRMPGLVVLDDVMTADGRNGIGLRFTDTTPWVLDGFTTQWILDRETGDLLETKVTGPGPANESIVTNTYGVTDQAGVPPAQ